MTSPRLIKELPTEKMRTGAPNPTARAASKGKRMTISRGLIPWKGSVPHLGQNKHNKVDDDQQTCPKQEGVPLKVA